MDIPFKWEHYYSTYITLELYCTVFEGRDCMEDIKIPQVVDHNIFNPNVYKRYNEFLHPTFDYL